MAKEQIEIFFIGGTTKQLNKKCQMGQSTPCMVFHLNNASQTIAIDSWR